MKRKPKKPLARYILGFLILGVVWSSQADAYWINVHRMMSRAAFERAVQEGDIFLRLGLSEFDDVGVRVTNNPVAVVSGTAVDNVMNGSADEDGGLRFNRHFYDVVSKDGFLNFASAPDWALDTLSNPEGFHTLRPLLFQLMTTKDNTQRDEARRRFFYHLGHLIHLIQDMAQPQHARLDIHFHPGQSRIQGEALFTGYSRYEFRTGERASSLSYDGYETVKLPDYHDYFDDSDGFVLEQGIAQATSFNFVSQDTNFDSLRYFFNPATRPPTPLPAAVGLPEDTPVSYYIVQLDPVFSAQKMTSTVPVRYVSYEYRDEYTRQIVRNPRLTALSIFDVANSAISLTGKPVFTLTDLTIDTHADILVPMAVGYSAGIIDHLLRGRMRITPPDDRIYAAVDQAKMDDRDKGFTKVRLKLRNTTPNITVRDAAGQTIVRQPIGEGTIQAVAKYRRNGCYAIDLRGEPDASTVSTQTMPNGCNLNTFIGGRDFISVSLSQNIAEVPSDRDKELEFDFSGDPIPIDARDLAIQVIFKGMLGVDDGIADGELGDGPDEADAVIVATRDISEPTYLGVLNMTDRVMVEGQFHTVNEINGDAALRDVVIREVAGVNNAADVADYIKIEAAREMTLRVNGALVATTASVPAGSHVRLALLLEQNPAEEFPVGKGTFDSSVFYKFDFNPLGLLTSGSGETLEARLDKLAINAASVNFSEIEEFRGVRFWVLHRLFKRVGAEPATDADFAALPNIFQPPLVELALEPCYTTLGACPPTP